ncbi:MAG: pyruvate dehydrogenase (acetyl-transferring) E1 component subunit alpha [Holosporales bacterium]|jgi:pyruvate dehydrogenase E1 component alpha subunit|nr:pyruvate dehydrogenase (acetyl-transferring) E1 component subunit alpha [Holosporales bacterium]
MKAQSYSVQDLFKFYGNMLLIRRFEEKCAQLYRKGVIGGFCHLYIGQEAVAAGMREVTSPDNDSIITTYRDHAHMLMCGIDPKVIMAELAGKITGCSKGKGGSMHMFSRQRRFYGGHGIVGASSSIGTGVAFSHQYKKDDGVCFCYFGDGATNQGQVYESFNMASMWKLPIVYIIENNFYAMGTSVNRSHANIDLYRRGEPFNVPGKAVDGMKIQEVIAAGCEAASHARSGKGPVILEMRTYRYLGHSMSDPATYRTKEEVEQVKSTRDPIEHVKNTIAKKQGLKESEIKDIESKVSNIVEGAADFALNSPTPQEKVLYEDVLI